MSHTSSASTKLLHGGLRYLEHFHFRLVREALRERAWWLNQVPDLTQPVELFLPVHRSSPRPAWFIGLGLWFYDRLAGSANIAPHVRLAPEAFKTMTPEIRHDDIQGGFRFYDGQMNDYALGLWVAEQARNAGAVIQQESEVSRVSPDGYLTLDGIDKRFDRVLNIAGPWAEALLKRSGAASRYQLELIRGSHIIFDEPLARGYLLQAPQDGRIFFMLPYLGKTLVGTTEEHHRADQPVRCGEEEAKYLVDAYNAFFRNPRSPSDIADAFSGVRPLIRSAAAPSKLSREYAVERNDRLVTVFGGKWTTARALAQRVTEEIA
jgi:glycerol-3-phosphate dehydrogenase